MTRSTRDKATGVALAARLYAETREAFGVHVRRLRDAQGWSQQDLGHHADTTNGAVSRFETGQGNPTLEMLCKLAVALGVTPTALLAPPPRARATASGRRVRRDAPTTLDALLSRARSLVPGLPIVTQADGALVVYVPPDHTHRAAVLELFAESAFAQPLTERGRPVPGAWRLTPPTETPDE